MSGGPGRGRSSGSGGRGGSGARGGRGAGGRRSGPAPSGRGRGGRNNAGGTAPRSGDRPNPGRGSSKRRPAGRGDNKEHEAKKLEEERKRREEEEAAAKKAVEEAEAKRLAEIGRRKALQSDYETSIKNCVATLESYVSGLKLREELRGQLDTNVLDGASCSPLMEERQKFEKTKKTLKSDLKKCTAFVKKTKSGIYPTGKELSLPNSPIKTLNLTRYVEEVAAAIMEPTQKIKPSEIPGLVSLCVEMHRRYDGFASVLVPSLMLGVTGKGGEETLPKRLCLRVLTEFVLSGIITDLKSIVRMVCEAAGAPSDDDKDYVVTDANVVVTFAKSGGLEVVGVIPKSMRAECERLQNEVSGNGEGKIDVADQAAEGQEENSETNNVDHTTPFAPTLSNELIASAQAVIETYKSTTTHSRAVSPSILATLHKHCIGAYRTIANSYVSTHRRLVKLEKRCEQDRLLQGNLSEAREKGLTDARTLLENLKKSVETLSDVLDVSQPHLPLSDEDEDATDAEDGKGISVWTKNENDTDENLGPFDDEETRAFYCDVPDFVSIKPAALLGLNAVDLEKQKERNERQYGGLGGENDLEAIGDMRDLEAKDDDLVEENGDGDENTTNEEKADGESEDGVNKETPHYKLMVLLEQELPEASRRETVDELADRFCTNHGSNAKSRKRLYSTLFLVPHGRLDLLPYWSRFAAILDRVYSDSTLVNELEQQMHGQAKFKKNQNVDARLRTARYLSELTKFRVAPPIVVLRGIKRCLEDFTGFNVDIACCFLENCGRYLYRTKHTHKKLSELMDTMMRIKKARNMDERHVAMINSAFFMVNPPKRDAQPTKEVPPLEAYLRFLLASKLEADEKSVAFVSKQIQRMPWSDPSIDCGVLVNKYMLKACRKGRYKATKAVALLTAKLKRDKPEVAARLIDTVVEEIQRFIENPSFRDNQRTLVCARVFGELYRAAVIPSSSAFDLMHHILNFGHDIPDSLREASDRQESFVPRGKVTQTILEDEEMEDGEEDNDVEEKPSAVPVSTFSKYDPRVFCPIDPPTAVFRIKIVTTILDTISSHVVTPSNKPKIEFILASLQRYLFVKTSLPSDVEFSVLDLFDALDSQLKKLQPDSRRKPQAATKSSAASFVRYSCWVDAHKFVVAAEEADVLSLARTKTRLLAQAGILGSQGTSTGDLLDDDTVGSGSIEMSNDEEEDSIDDGESDSDVEDEKLVKGDVVEVDVSGSESEEESEDDEDPIDDQDEIALASAEEAYIRQLQDEAFESELRKLTMDALEKGKNTARTGAGGKVSSQMPAAPQFMAKKPHSDLKQVEEESQNPFVDGGGIAFKLLKKGNKGKMEEKQFLVPSSTNLAHRATKHDDKAAKEHDLLKAKVLQYEAESAEAGGNLYLNDSKLQVINNRPLTMETIDSNFGKSKDAAPYKISERFKGRGAISSTREGGRGGRGRGAGRLFNPGRG